MSKRKQNKEKLAQALGLVALGVISTEEFERRCHAAGVITDDVGSFKDVPDEVLLTMFEAAGENMAKAHCAALMVLRGLTACSCEYCQRSKRTR